jgi:hypothetical protein
MRNNVASRRNHAGCNLREITLHHAGHKLRINIAASHINHVGHKHRRNGIASQKNCTGCKLR